MLYWAAIFLLVASITGFFGFGGLAFASAGISQALSVIFLALCVAALIGSVRGGRGEGQPDR
ncbi:DUF1328 domain-containing protein [Frigidibacter sp. MR17.24]|uniref:DUF1328 domain-containing protein n=1 Tax=Frigidibacter sp. MR17.24 TaxID=3127345 RepID=UPI003012FCE0